MDSKLHSLLSENKETIARRWLDRVVESYSADSARFMRQERDRFANPVGQRLTRGVHALLDVLLLGAPDDELRKALDTVVRVRAVQELSASQALGFVFQLKDVVRELLAKQLEELAEGARHAELGAFERQVDHLALLAFEVYLGCKEQLYELRVGEMKRRTAKLVERMNRIYGDPVAEQDNV